MGADLFGSYAESTCAALVIAATCPDLVDAGWSAIVFPMEVRGGSAVELLVLLVVMVVVEVVLLFVVKRVLHCKSVLVLVLCVICGWVA